MRFGFGTSDETSRRYKAGMVNEEARIESWK